MHKLRIWIRFLFVLPSNRVRHSAEFTSLCLLSGLTCLRKPGVPNASREARKPPRFPLTVLGHYRLRTVSHNRIITAQRPIQSTAPPETLTVMSPFQMNEVCARLSNKETICGCILISLVLTWPGVSALGFVVSKPIAGTSFPKPKAQLRENFVSLLGNGEGTFV